MHCLSSVTHVGTTVANERVGKGTYVGYRATMSSYRLSAVCGSAAVWPQFWTQSCCLQPCITHVRRITVSYLSVHLSTRNGSVTITYMEL